MSEGRVTWVGVATRSPAETPLMRQYLDVKERIPTRSSSSGSATSTRCSSRTRCSARALLDLTLTTRDKGKDDAVPMCGVPHHAARGYIAKLTELGHRVAIVRAGRGSASSPRGSSSARSSAIVTPGVVLDDEVLEPKRAALRGGAGRGERRGERRRARVPRRDDRRARARPSCRSATVVDELVRVAPREVLADAATAMAACSRAVRARYRAAWNRGARCRRRRRARASWRALACDGARTDRERRARRCARAAARASRTRARPSRPARCRSRGSRVYSRGDAVVLDEAAIANLELVETLIGQRDARARCST